MHSKQLLLQALTGLSCFLFCPTSTSPCAEKVFVLFWSHFGCIVLSPTLCTFENARCLCTIAAREGKQQSRRKNTYPRKPLRILFCGFFFFFYLRAKTDCLFFLHLLTLNWFGKFPCLLTSGVLRALLSHFLLCVLSDLGEKLDLGWGVSNSVQLCPQ